MSRSFGIVEYKIEESEFFLHKFTQTLDKFAFAEAQFYLSAFLSASRSITFAIQASISDLPRFKDWYQEQQNILKDNKLAKFFLEARNASQKTGYYLIAGGTMVKGADGKQKHVCFFEPVSNLDYYPEEDVQSGCERYFASLLTLVQDCYKTFGGYIDPERFYTLKHMEKSGMTIEDVEEDAGFPRGWTDVDDFSDEVRLEMIASGQAKSTVDWIFEKHLGSNRFGLLTK